MFEIKSNMRNQRHPVLSNFFDVYAFSVQTLLQKWVFMDRAARNPELEISSNV